MTSYFYHAVFLVIGFDASHLAFSQPPHPAAQAATPTVSPPSPSAATAAQPIRQQQTIPGNLEPKDYVLAAGVAVTLLLGIWNVVSNHSTSRRTTFVNTVTSQRIKSIEQLRQDVASYAGLIYHWAYTDLPSAEERRSLIKEVDRLNRVIRLRLNPAGENDGKIETLLAEIPKNTENQEKVSVLLEELTVTSQRLLKEEWEKVKVESRNGPLSDRA